MIATSYIPETLFIKIFSDICNFGDVLGLIICKKLLPQLNFKVVKPYEYCDNLNLISIGSILKGADSNSIIWGAGFIDTNEHLHSKPKAICAVRGPLSNKKIQQQGLETVKVLGDPAYLISIFFDEDIPTRFKYGIIPHYVDSNDHRIKNVKKREDVLIIDVQQDPVLVIKQIKSCSYILSSSLHGIICADAFNIPAVYIKLSENLAGNGFKFIDYFLSCGRRDHYPYVIGDQIDFKRAIKKIENFKNSVKVQDLKNCFPFS